MCKKRIEKNQNEMRKKRNKCNEEKKIEKKSNEKKEK